MDTKEAIEFMNENILDFKERTKDEELFDKNECKIFIKKAEGVVLLLERGGKYEAMYEEIYNELHNNYNWYVDVMEEVRQKYFPKEADINEAKMVKSPTQISK